MIHTMENVAPIATPSFAPLLRALAGSAGALGLVILSGCGGKSFMDPSVTGRWEHTPTTMPILDRIGAIEDQPEDIVEYSDPLPEDLIPRPTSYRIGSADVLEVTVFDLITPGEEVKYNVVVDPRGMIEVPQLGRITVAGKTTEDAVKVIEDEIKNRNLVQNPLVQVVATSQRQSTFTIVGAAQNPGLFQVPKADYRLLEAIANAGSFDENIGDIYVIRQVPLSDEVVRGIGTNQGGSEGSKNGQPTPTPAQPTPQDGQNIIDLIDTIAPPPATTPTTPAEAPKESPKESDAPASPGQVSGQVGGQVGSAKAALGAALRVRQEGQPPAKPQNDQPLIDLIEPGQDGKGPQTSDGSTWVFVNGKWVKVKGGGAAEASAATPGSYQAEQLITQRVIRITVKDLLAGKQSINIVVRPGDVVRFPSGANGFVYMAGDIGRPGSYQIVPGLTIMRAVSSAGGLGETAVPWRVDLVRKVGKDRQATIRLDYNAIAMQTQPDVYLKPDDLLNFGTADWALPLAVVRNGFRASYGFGFILDRNLGNDIFGPPPTNSFGQ
jgi:polysaccharide biosynthesis/export protein